MFTRLNEWTKLRGSGIDELLLELVNDDENIQKVAYEALQYNLLNLGADRDENYGDPHLLFNNNLHMDVIPLLLAIATEDTTSALSKYFALYLLWDIHNFVDHNRVKQQYSQKATLIRKAINSPISIYQNLLLNGSTEVQKRAQKILNLIAKKS